MVDSRALRPGGISGILYAILVIPAYFVASPHGLAPDLSAQETVDFFGRDSNALIFNGVVTIFATFFFLWFLGLLHGMLRRVEGEEESFSSAALAGGLLFITLSCSGRALEILYPATLARFENFQPDAQLAFLSVVLSAWLYYFAQVGTSVLIAATSVVALRTGVLPRWLVWGGFLVALLTLLHFLLAPLGAYLGLLWVTMISVLMLTGSFGRPRLATRS